jgi:hypothetical protein
MLRALAAYLLVFWLLGLVVHLGGLVHLFGVIALALLGIDLLMANSASSPRTSRTRERSLL